MAYVANTYQSNHVADTDLQNMENNFEYLRNNFKSSSAPVDPGGGLEGVTWWDSTNKTFKIRDAAAWRGVFTGGASFKIWAYLDAVPDGWTRDSAVTDMVLALKGGAVYTVGGAVGAASSWTISGLTKDAHTHSAGTLALVHTHNTQYDGWTHAGGGTAGRILIGSGTPVGNIDHATADRVTTGASTSAVTGATGAQSDAGVTHTPGWRIRGATGILLYPKI